MSITTLHWLFVLSLGTVTCLKLEMGGSPHPTTKFAFSQNPAVVMAETSSSSIQKCLSHQLKTAVNPISMAPLSPVARNMANSFGSRHEPSPFRTAMALGDGKSAVLDKPIVAPAPQETQKKQPDKPYHVLLFNDPVNTREYVCEVLCEVFGHSKSQAYKIMQVAHSTGFAVCNTTDKEEADLQSAKLGEKDLMSSVIQAD